MEHRDDEGIPIDDGDATTNATGCGLHLVATTSRTLDDVRVLLRADLGADATWEQVAGHAAIVAHALLARHPNVCVQLLTTAGTPRAFVAGGEL